MLDIKRIRTDYEHIIEADEGARGKRGETLERLWIWSK